MGRLIPALDALRHQRSSVQDLALNAFSAGCAASIDALVDPCEGLLDILEMIEFTPGNGEVQDFHLALQVRLERDRECPWRFVQRERFHGSRQMHEEPFPR